MKKPAPRRAPARKASKGPGVAGRLGAALAARPVPVFGTLAATVATGAVLANMLLMQPGPHPAPLFSATPADAPAGAVTGQTEAPASLLVKDVQTALATRGFYSGPIDGYAGPSTAAAIRDFETAEGLAVTGVASEKVLVRALLGPSATASVTTTTTTRVPPPAPSHSVAANVDVKRIQQALADLGYGPLTVDGKAGGQTASAIRRFRLDHGLPVNGDIDDRLVATLAGIGGLSTN
ncbi:peptidoglycan-binding domain-containing protein [Pseudoxanthobacter sp. M-2]|uniref:peptidoglycan-binding domain-containing protein n=1 Tax=Pseudoxanthobacter sp. M-2 TaxID=3078754 RepID=UPI0038FCD5DC